MKLKYNKLLVVVLLLELVQLGESLCSIYCPVTACNGTSYNLCQSCDQVFALNSSMLPNCQPYAPTGFVFEASSVSGLSVSYPSAASTSCSSITNINGWFNPTDAMRVQYPGITRPYQSIKIFFGIISTGSWSGSEQIQINFNNQGTSQFRSIFARDYALNGKCSADNTDYIYRIRQDYTYTVQNTPLSWDVRISGTNVNSLGSWAVTEVLMLLQACDRRCLTCTTSPIVCTSCVTSGTYQSFLVTSNSTCVESALCPSSTYAQVATHVCESCNVSNCITCTTVNVCTVCASGFYLHLSSSCVSTCPNKYYANIAAQKCDPCANECFQCTSLSVCTACTTSGTYQSFLSGSSCLASSSCPSGTYAEPLTHICESCNTSCLTCLGNKNNCTSCISTLFYLTNVCYSTCPNGYYGNTGTGNCTLCDPKCTMCSILATNCSACTTSGADESFLTGTSCVASTSCPSGTYPDSSTHICTACNTSCLTCSVNKDNCTSCISTLFYLSNVCYSTCPNGYYGNTGTGNCTVCDPKCTICSILATNCSACTASGASQSFLTGTSCVASTSCPVGTYPEPSTHICTACNSSCITCLNTVNNCTSCISTLFYLTNVCYSTCPNGYYGNTGTGNCTLCDSKCTMCSILSTNCSACTTSGASESYLTGTSCVASTSCPAGTYPEPSTHICTTCNSSCVTCLNTVDNCTECILSLYILSNICYSNCPNGYYQSAPALKQCIICNQYCTLCDIISTNCSACQTSGVNQAFLNINACVVAASCPAGTYPEPSTHICTTCNSSCATCTGNADNCTSCVLGLFYLSNVCYTVCPNGYYNSAPAVKQCLTCDSRCTICNVSATNCSACTTSGTFQSYLNTLTSTCVVITSCPIGQYGNVATHVCQACNSSCYNCTGNMDNCLWCATGLYILGNICYTVCPLSYYGTGGKCILCNQLCLTCTGTLVSQCLSCHTSGLNQSFFLAVNTTCYIDCPTGYYQVVADHSCQKCDISCASCTASPSPCQSCNSSYNYFNETCLSACPAGYWGKPTPPLTYKVCTPCIEQCLTCFGGLDSQCYTCNFDLMVKKSGSYCRPNCMPGWGDIKDSEFCVYCNQRCTSCYNSANNCTSCKTSGTNQGFMIITDLVANTGNCYGICPAGYFANKTTHFCDNCTSPCKTCNNISTNCTSCITAYYFLNFTCLSACPNGYYINGANCTACDVKCWKCNITSTNCSLCNANFPAFLLNSQCYDNCPLGYYNNPDTLTNNFTCQLCAAPCKACTWDPSPCSACNPTYFFFQNTCNTTCYEPGYFPDIVTWQCLLCDLKCVQLDLKMAFETVLEESILVTLTFTQDIDWTTFPMQTFQQFSFDDPFFNLDMFSFQYTVISANSYQIKITPKLYIFMYNLGIYVTTMQMPSTNFQAINKRPFHISVYNRTQNLIWWHIKAPGVTDQQKNIIEKMINFTNQFQNFVNQTGVREIVQSGVLALFLPGIQITSAVVLVNGIIPQHMYEGIRIMATAIFYQVPKWEKGAPNSRFIFSNSIKDLVQSTLITKFSASQQQQLQDGNLTYIYEEKQSINSLLPTAYNDRRILQKSLPENWRFKRTGFSTFFLIDIYLQLILIGFSWLLLLIFTKLIYKKDPTHTIVAKIYIFFHKVHELSLMYFTLGMILQWIQFNEQTEEMYKWVSFVVCFVILGYYLAYELYIYYDLFQYPFAHVNTRSYLMYVTKYGCFLSKIRFQQYDVSQEWSPKVWFRPYNYHILSFYKKFMMMFALPIFHQLPYTQASCLILLQVMEMIRFCITWPFNSKFRNIYRIVLQSILLCIFIVVLITQYLSAQLMKNNSIETSETLGQYFNKLGWIGLIMVLFFNISIFLITFIDMIKYCKNNHIEQIDNIRKKYYWQKVKKYQNQNQDLKLDVVTNWVKLGNLKQIKTVHEDSKYIMLKIEKLKLEKISDFYQVQIVHVTGLKIREQGYVYQQNSRRINIQNKIRKFVEISVDSDKQFYELFTAIYQKYNVQQQFVKAKKEQLQRQSKMLYQQFKSRYKYRERDFYEVVIETFIKVDLNQYENGGRIKFKREGMTHNISLYLNQNKVLKIKENAPIDGLPLDNRLLETKYLLKGEPGDNNGNQIEQINDQMGKKNKKKPKPKMYKKQGKKYQKLKQQTNI